ncbi:MAG: hypothetical protein ACI3V0_03115 [Faecousia sp.]
MPRNRRFHWILPATEGAALHWMPPAKAALPPLETTAKGTLPPLETTAKGYSVPFGFPSQQGAPRPYWKPRAKGIAIPLESQPVLK